MTAEMRIRIASAASEIAAADWDRLQPHQMVKPQDGNSVCQNDSIIANNPFTSHAFFRAVEDSGCACAKTGWLPQHLVLEAEDGAPAGIAPTFLKNHSQGEYVFDHGWADALERAGGDYYPKLQSAVPFTPATGPRLIVGDSPGADVRRAALLAGQRQLCARHKASSAHITFMNDDDWQAAAAQGYLQRTDQQFHWHNRGYGSFDDFLGDLSSRKRKNIRKERETAFGKGIVIERLTGAQLTEAVWDDFFAFYMDTGSRKWGRPYLNREFYSLVGQSMADRIFLIMASRNGRRIAGAINFVGADTLYGRHWGCVEDHPCLHFEVCYYQAIEWAIENRIAVVEAGAQGEHKLARGYVPVTTRSAHWIAHPGLRRAVDDYLEQERQHVAYAGEALMAHAPFRKAGGAKSDENAGGEP